MHVLVPVGCHATGGDDLVPPGPWPRHGTAEELTVEGRSRAGHPAGAWLSLGRPILESVLILGHRGSVSSTAPENTLASIDRALRLGADGVEIDVRITADSVMVVHHDPVMRRSAGDGRAISAMTVRDLPRMRGHSVPRLDDVLDLMRGRGQLIVELKAPHWTARTSTVAALVDTLSRHRLEGVTVSSFDRARVLRVRESGLGVCTALLGRPGVSLPTLLRRVRHDGHAQAHPHLSSALIRSDLLRGVRLRGWEVVVWTVNRPDDVRRLQAAGLHGLITDEVVAARTASTVPFAETG